jgi:methionyl-tRNA formyltransferase
VGADLLSETLTRLAELTPVKQNDAEMTLAPIMKKEDGIIDWTMNADQINNRARGFQPFPTAYTFYQGKRLIIWKAQPAAGETPVNPGEVVEAKGDLFVIGCGSNTVLQPSEVQLEGKRRMVVRDLLNGVKVQVGEKLG